MAERCRCRKSMATVLLVPGDPTRARCYECGRTMPVGPPVRPRAKDRIPRVTPEPPEFFSVNEADLAPQFRRVP